VDIEEDEVGGVPPKIIGCEEGVFEGGGEIEVGDLGDVVRQDLHGQGFIFDYDTFYFRHDWRG
jgi:hypothetical protein